MGRNFSVEQVQFVYDRIKGLAGEERRAKSDQDLGWTAVEGMKMPERVALLFVTATGAEFWYDLKNSAPILERHKSFMVGSEEVETALRDAQTHGVEPSMRFLWHSHVLSAEPSKDDVESYPGWLVDGAIVSCLTTGDRTLYNASGVIQTVSGSSSGPRKEQ